jgi:hypothetical protein
VAKKKGKKVAIRPEIANWIRALNKRWKSKGKFSIDLLCLDHKFFFCGLGRYSKTANAREISDKIKNLPGFFMCVGSPLVTSPFLEVKLGNKIIMLEGVGEIKAYISKISKRARSHGLSKEQLIAIAKAKGIDPAFPGFMITKK